MPLNLHKECRERIKQRLAEKLPSVEVTNKKYLKRESTAGILAVSEALPSHGEIVNVLHNIIGEWPLYDFLYGLLSKELNDNQKYDTDSPVLKLTDLDEYSDADATADRLLDEFESLPWKYKFTVDIKTSLSTLFNEETSSFQVSDSISVIQPDDEFKEAHPLDKLEGGNKRNLLGLGLLGSFMPHEWDNDTLYLQFLTEGFVGKFVSTRTTENVLSELKAFFGLAIALRLLKIEYSYQLSTPKLHFVVHKFVDDAWVAYETEEIDEATTKTINNLVFHDIDGELDNDLKKSHWAKIQIEKISAVFNEKKKAEKILLASQWFFESYSGTNELLSFVQTMVALEILLGDKATSDVIGLGELLRNRCAYLIGVTHDQRQDILDGFKEIYDIRSKIIHRGKSRLTMDERTLFRNLQWICRRVIQEEIELLKKNT